MMTLDLNFIRENKELVANNITRRGMDPEKADVDVLLELDDERRKLVISTDALRAKKNELAKGFTRADEGKKTDLREQGDELKTQIQSAEEKLKQLDTKINAIAEWIPNMLAESVPDGEGESYNIEVKVWDPEKKYMPDTELGKSDNQKSREFFTPLPFEGKDHIKLGKDLDLIDIDQATKVSGSRFYYLKNEAVLFDIALTQFLINELVRRGFVPLYPPLLVRERALFGTSHFPEQKDQIYKIATDQVEDQNQLYLLGSSESSNFSYFADKTLDAEALPQKVFAYTTCFRTEVGSWGKDVRGIKRVHQFNKLEMNVVSLPQESSQIFEELLGINEWLLQSLKQPYRIVRKCAKDCGYSASHEQYDIEIWSRAQKVFTEWGTDTNATDFQARRLNIRYKTASGEKGYVHTINDTGVAMPRTILSWLENNQREDGSVLVPEILQEAIGKSSITPTK